MVIEMKPIGTIHTDFHQAHGTPIQGSMAQEAEGEVHVFPKYEAGLQDLDGFSHIVLLYAFHLSQGFRLTVVPYLDTSPRGLFATRAPLRPNPLGLTIVRLLGIEGGVLRVRGVDMLDGTPLLDIKPHVPAFDDQEEVRLGWLEPRLREVSEKGFKCTADRRFHTDEED